MSSSSESGFAQKNNSSSRVLSSKLYQSGPPVPFPKEQEVLSTTRTEELTKKKKTDTLITKQIETRVRREIVVTEDGEIVEDSGPKVTTETTEQSRTEEQENTEKKTSGADDPGPGWTLVPGSQVVRETTRKNNSTNEIWEEKTDTEITEEVGGLTREEINRALKQKEQAALLRSRDSSASSPVPGSRVQLSSRSHRVVDTEEKDVVSEYKDGQVTTESKSKTNREEYFDSDGPDDEVVDDQRSPRRILEEGHAILVNGSSGGSRQTSSRKKSSTSSWIDNHFGSDEDYKKSSKTFPRGHRGGEVRLQVDSDDSGSQGRKIHYSRRQQIPLEKSTKPCDSSVTLPPPPPGMSDAPVKPPRSHRKSPNGHYVVGSDSFPKQKYYLGEDPGVGERFLGMTSRNGVSDDEVTAFGQRLGVKMQQQPRSPYCYVPMTTTKSATLGREVPATSSRTKERYDSSSGRGGTTSNGFQNGSSNHNHCGSKNCDDRGTFCSTVDSSAMPSVSDIIYSLRSKAFLEKENSAVSIRDDDSVIDFGTYNNWKTTTTTSQRLPSSSKSHRHFVSSPQPPQSKQQHVIKIAIKSDDSDCSSSTINSPGHGKTSSSSRNFQSNGDSGHVRSAIHNLFRSRLSDDPRSPGSSNTNSLSRNHQRPPSNLSSTKTYLTASSPNVNKLDQGGGGGGGRRVTTTSPQKKIFNGHRSQSIGNLSNGHVYTTTTVDDDDWSSSGHHWMQDRGRAKRNQFMQKLLADEDDEEDSGVSVSRTTPYKSHGGSSGGTSWSRRSGTSSRRSPGEDSGISPPLSPSYSSRIKLPSPVPPSGGGGNSSPSSPPPSSFSRYQKCSPRATTPSRPFVSRSPSPPPFVHRRPPSPVLPRSSVATDDGGTSSSNASSSDRSASRRRNERVEVSNRKKVTTTSVTKREVELPDSDYYYEEAISNGGSLGRGKSRSMVHVNGR